MTVKSKPEQPELIPELVEAMARLEQQGEVESTDKFDWCNSPSVIVRQQDALAIYQNPYGQTVIRRQRDWNEEDDAITIIDPRHAIIVAQAILANAGHRAIEMYEQSSGGCVDVADEYEAHLEAVKELRMTPAQKIQRMKDDRPDIDWNKAEQVARDLGFDDEKERNDAATAVVGDLPLLRAAE